MNDDEGSSLLGTDNMKPPSTQQLQQDPQVLDLRVKSFKEVDIRISESCNVARVKKVITDALGEQAHNRYLRLICKGRLLAPDSSQLSEFSVQNGDVVHAVLAAVGVRGGQQAALSRSTINTSTTGTTTRRHRTTRGLLQPGGRIVRGAGADSDIDDSSNDSGDDLEDGNGNRRERLGFDRLRQSPGLSRSEVRAVRSYFSSLVDTFIQANPVIAQEIANNSNSSLENSNNNSSSENTNGDNQRRLRLMQEDAWMSRQGPASEFHLNLTTTQASSAAASVFFGTSRNTDGNAPVFRATTVGTDRDFVWGFMLGFFVGFLMLVWVWMPTVPHKQKLGILTGISFQLAMSFFKDDDDGDAEFASGE